MISLIKIGTIILLQIMLAQQNGQHLANATKVFARIWSTLFSGGQQTMPISKWDRETNELREKIDKLEHSLRNTKQMEPLKVCQTKIQIAIEKFHLELNDKVEHYNAIRDLINDKSTEGTPKYHEENVQLWNDSETVRQHIRRLNSLIMVYRRAAFALNAACELHMDSNKLELFEPQYSNAFIQFIVEGGDFCTKVKMGKNVAYPDVRADHGYNFFEKLFEEISNSTNTKQIVKKMEFSLNKKEQKKDYDSIMGPRGALRNSGILMRQGQIGMAGTIEILGGQKVNKNGVLKNKILNEQLYKVSNAKTNASFEVRLVFSDSRKKMPLSDQKLLALHIHAIN